MNLISLACARASLLSVILTSLLWPEGPGFLRTGAGPAFLQSLNKGRCDVRQTRGMDVTRSSAGVLLKFWVLSCSTGALLVLAASLAAQGGPVNEPPEANRVELGRLLFWDPILSGDRDVACATCHHPDFAYADGRDLSLGAGAIGLGPTRVDVSNGRITVVRRNSPTVLNTAFNGVGTRRGRRRGGDTTDSVDQASAPMFWDNRLRGLEAQALEPLKALEEMRGTAYAEADALDIVVARLQSVPEYVTLFQDVFGRGTAIDATQVGQAIAAFERSLVAMESPFDRFRAGDADAVTAQQRRGFDAFDEAGCDRCHPGYDVLGFCTPRRRGWRTCAAGRAGRGRRAVPLPHAVAPQCGLDGPVHAQRRAGHARRRTAFL